MDNCEGQDAEEHLADVDLDVAEAEADSFDHLDFSVDTLRIGVGCSIVEEVEDIGTPSLQRPSPLDHRGIIGKTLNFDQVFQPIPGGFFRLQLIELPQLFFHPIELFQGGIKTEVAFQAFFFPAAEPLLAEEEYFLGNLPTCGILFDFAGLIHSPIGILDQVKMIDDDGCSRQFLLNGGQKHLIHVDTSLPDAGLDLRRDLPQKALKAVLAAVWQDGQRTSGLDVRDRIDHPGAPEAVAVDSQGNLPLQPGDPLRIDAPAKDAA